MATTSSQWTRVRHRRAAVMDEALDHAVALMSEQGVGALSVSEVARRMGIRGPSLYKYFPSRHAFYDALFARGLASQQAAVRAAVDGVPRGVPRIRAGATAVVRWAVEHPALAQLLHWRPVPGFEPSPGVFAPAEGEMVDVRAEFAEAVRLGQLAPGADSDEVVRLYTVVLSGLISQQLANQPGATYAEGVFSRLTEIAIDSFLSPHFS
ncbi:TetR/AcrR family transcriptional regulator [Blastococcus sp. CT_GayMR19]|uniref:TetR/AcrR family transcriptional regulator n=1 Tax=Blastococcus sp. CT_GayMR19 TaxID=2559608 RepID=UPI00107417F2|nr:TetR/AcrR family transcriptional regulator [Blastococcus sp. CT_GayMR19]TFV74348.1 TetR/AcrR family transcriptional regulator [Blastococcus sp. CT_GayMR19]